MKDWLKQIDKDMSEIPTWVRRTSAVSSGVIIASLIVNACRPASAVSQEELDCNDLTKKLNIDPNASSKLKSDRAFDSFTSAHPEYEGREMYLLGVTLPLCGIPSETIILPANETESDEINSRQYKFDDVNGNDKALPHDKAIVWTKMVNADGTLTWERLAGTYYLNEDKSITTVWYYNSEDEFGDTSKDIHFDTPVIAFNSSDSKFILYPLTDNPEMYDWAENLDSRNPDDYSTWNGTDPFYISTLAVESGGIKVLYAPAAIVENEPSQNYIEVQELIASSEKYTLINGILEMKNENGTISTVEGIKDSNLDGIFELTIDGEQKAATIQKIDGDVIYFTLSDGSIITWNGEELSFVSPEPALPAEMEELFEKLGAELGEDENGKPIYFVTNPAGETVVVGKTNEEENKWEKADAVKFRLFKTVEEAEASGEIMDTEYVLRGGPGQAAKLNGEPFPEDVLTGLNIEVITPNFTNAYSEQLNFDSDGLYLIKENPDRAPYRNMGYFLFKTIYKGVEQSGYGTVWQWMNPDGSYVYITATATKMDSVIVSMLTPFASFNYTKDLVNAPIANEIGHDIEINKLMLQWAETDEVPAELQDRALLISYLFR